MARLGGSGRRSAERSEAKRAPANDRPSRTSRAPDLPFGVPHHAEALMTASHRRIAVSAALALAATACSSTGGLGSILGGVLGQQGNQVSGTVQGLDTRNQQIGLQQSNGQTVAL